jgi:hypothetical protein
MKDTSSRNMLERVARAIGAASGDNPVDLTALKPLTGKGPTCADCRFMVMDAKDMVCRKRPPTACVLMVPIEGARMVNGSMQKVMGMQPQPVTVWPIVRKDWHCFEHEPAFPAAPKGPFRVADHGAFGPSGVD